jgi:sulfite reductase alpha subunit-like flavoprotein
MGRGRSVYKQPGTRVDKDRTTQKGGIQVSERDPGTRGVIKGSIKGSHQGESSRGVSRGVIKGLRHMLNNVNLYIYTSCYCVNVANKRIVFRL